MKIANDMARNLSVRLMACQALEPRLMLTTYTVTTVADSGTGSLRDAITAANANPGADLIVFNISGAGIRRIALSAPLPVITDSITIDGSTNSNTFAQDHTPVVQLDGASAGTDAVGIELSFAAPATTIHGLIFSHFSGSGIRLDEGSNNDHIVGNYIGTADGITPTQNRIGIRLCGENNFIGGTNLGDGNLISGNSNYGVYVQAFDSMVGNFIQGNLIGTNKDGIAELPNGDIGIKADGAMTIGGPGRAARNIISGNVLGITLGEGLETVQGNYIGTDMSGAHAISNGTGIQVDGSDSLIGGEVSGAGNLISGNFGSGIDIFTGRATIQGNYIGTDASGTAALGNQTGISGFGYAQGNQIGGADPAAGNIISGNSGDGILLKGPSEPEYGYAIEGNRIGPGINGESIPNQGNGISLSYVGSNGIDRNIIANNARDGVLIDGTQTVPNDLYKNSIYNNGGLGIHLTDGDENSLAPVLDSIRASGSTETIVNGRLGGPAGKYRLDFYLTPASERLPAVEGETFLHSVTIQKAAGIQPFRAILPTVASSHKVITATATGSRNHVSSSQFGALIGVAAPPTLLAGPADRKVISGHGLSFSAEAVGTARPTVRWQVSVDGGNTFTDIAGNDSAMSTTLRLTRIPFKARNSQYRAIFTNQYGSATTAPAHLTVLYGPGIRIVQPARANPSVTSGTRTQLAAEGVENSSTSGLTYRWTVIRAPEGTTPVSLSVQHAGTGLAIARFHAAGTYLFHCTISDTAFHSNTTDVSVLVRPRATALRLTPQAQHVRRGERVKFHAVLCDQFGSQMPSQPPIRYSVASGQAAATIDDKGFFTASESGFQSIEADTDIFHAEVRVEID